MRQFDAEGLRLDEVPHAYRCDLRPRGAANEASLHGEFNYGLKHGLTKNTLTKI